MGLGITVGWMKLLGLMPPGMGPKDEDPPLMKLLGLTPPGMGPIFEDPPLMKLLGLIPPGMGYPLGTELFCWGIGSRWLWTCTQVADRASNATRAKDLSINPN